ncbi:hypothetical protein Aboo_0389 [Aciduliprofundum boonei T469]|uniref:Uncharacterized protein n=2 Tax=Candidatus Aciduliprofundum boonei TaxID=379547 RepID=D3TCB5_ACIB4|nr:hypothetical protein Aboo_0389 [Aciduliprofundum boonei T469]
MDKVKCSEFTILYIPNVYSIGMREKSSMSGKERVFKKPWSLLSPREKMLREKSLEVLARVRKGESLSSACKKVGISPNTVIKSTNAFKKVNGRWIAKRYDKISRVMDINENGKKISIEVNDSRYASIIGKYHNAVRIFLETGDITAVERFRNIKIKDAQGNIHKLETDPEKLVDIARSIEEPEFYEIYNW